MHFYFLIICIFILFNVNAQTTDEYPFKKIENDLSSYEPGNVIARMIDGLGFRFYWATEDLREGDLKYKPGPEARSTEETIEHIYELSLMILNSTENLPNIRPENLGVMSYNTLRLKTLQNLQLARTYFKDKKADEIEPLAMLFQSGENKTELPLWNLINGPLADAIYHTGQIVSFRRSSGNPINPNVNLLTGETKEE